MAGMISKADVQKVREAADLYDVVAASVTLKPAGSGSFVGLCPFHDEKTPSFNIQPALGRWHCFGCGLGGDIFAFVEQRESIDFREAVEYLADRYHIELHYERGGANDEQHHSTRAKLLEANEQAQRFFTQHMLTPEALPARAMLAGRNFSKENCEHFGCGYAPQGWDNLVRYLADRGFTHQQMLDAGLVRRGQRGVYDYFRGRATWPIRDATGRILGFGARKLYDDDKISAKYINTPDTALYHKNQVLYGIDLAKSSIVAQRQAVIVEGYTDVMACHLAGVTTAVATCGTAFGAEHAKIIRRLIADDSLGAIQLTGPLRVAGQALSSRVVFTFDGDAAGQKAALHAFQLDTAFLTQTFVAVAEDNLDPCDLRLQRGDAAIRKLIEGASPLFDFVIMTALHRFDTSYTAGQMGAVKAVAPLIAQIRDRSLLDIYERKVARDIGVDLDMMHREITQARRRLHVRDEDAYAPRGLPPQRSSFERAGGLDAAAKLAIERRDAAGQRYYRIDDAVFIAEQQFMGALLQLPSAVNPVLWGKLQPQSFMTPVFRSLFQAIIAAGGLPQGVPARVWLQQLTEVAGPLLAPVIDELAVMPLPIADTPQQPTASQIMASQATMPHNVTSQSRSPQLSAQSSQMPQPSAAARQYVTELMVRLLDASMMRMIAATRARMAQLPEGEQKLRLLSGITQLEAARADLKRQALATS